MTGASVSRTMAEIAAVAAKAARGAGCAWGVAEEAGQAARTLEAHGLPGVSALAALFATPRDCACDGCSGPAACGLAAMVAVSDRAANIADGETMRFGHVVAPVLLAAPLIHAAGRYGCGFAVTWDKGRVTCGPAGLRADTRAGAGTGDGVTVERAPQPDGASCGRIGPAEVPAADWAVLETLAARTLVPESDESRARGAGPADSGTD